jgi:hypothetical protein
MKKTIKDLFIENEEYILPIIEIPNTNYGLFVEGLDNNGCSIDTCFNINKVKNILVELMVMEEKDKIYDYVETVADKICLDNTIEELIEKTKYLLED